MLRRNSQDGGDGTDEDRSRRDFLRGVGSTAAATGLAVTLAERDIPQPVRASEHDGTEPVFDADSGSDPDAVFPQSVASGGPTPSGVILWTRIDPDAYRGGVDLGLEVATDENFEDVVHHGVVENTDIGPEHDYTVKVDLDGELDSDRFYHYRFTYDGVRSRAGRCRTTPGPDASPDELSFGVVSCQHYQNGYYPAYHYLADEDVDFLLHLGDFIYETADDSHRMPGAPFVRGIDLPSGSWIVQDVDDYRHLYNTYREDRFLQEALEQHTMIVTQDDHEVIDDPYWDYEDDVPRSMSPIVDFPGAGDGLYDLTADAIQAWMEQIPARVEYDPDEEHLHDRFELWRDFEMGDLIDLGVIDERLRREEPPCDALTVGCEGNAAPGRTMLGEQQKEWFFDWIDGSDAQWTLWMNQVKCMPLTLGEGSDEIRVFHQSWDGYIDERRDILGTLDEDGVENFVALTGDLHMAIAGYLQPRYPGTGDPEDRVGVEFLTPSVTSVNAPEEMEIPGWIDDDLFSGLAKRVNDHLEFGSFFHHGYSVLDVTRDHCTWTVYAVDKNVNDADADRWMLTRLRTPDGEDTLEPVPDAAMAGGSRTVEVGDSVAFDAGPSSPPVDGAIERYEWRFDDGTTAEGERVEHAFDEPGHYTVSLRVVDGEGSLDSTGAKVTVVEDGSAPTASFEVSTRGRTLEAEASDPGAEELEWNLGDGTTATGPRVVHEYDAPGEYEVTLAVTDGPGATATSTRTVRVGASQEGGPVTVRETGTLDAGGSVSYTYDPRSDDSRSATVTLDGPDDADFDLYLTLDGRRPARTDHDVRSSSPYADERVTVDLQESTAIGLLVDAYSGSGDFELTVEERGG